MIKKLLMSGTVILVVLLALNKDLVQYGLKQAKGQLAITFNTQSVKAVLEDTSVSDSIKAKIEIIKQARKFSFDSLALSRSDNYTTFYDQQGKVALWNLSASEQYELKPKLWSFPILGSFPYKGFFDLEAAKEEFEKLKQEGYDARIRPVGGWSTLGWTVDPILSSMLNRTEGSLVELIIHELTHSTVFVKDDIQFNENLATFVGEKGTILFLNQKYGNDSKPYFEYIHAEEDAFTFRTQMLTAAKCLDSLYQQIENQPNSIKSTQKKMMIDQIIASIDTLHFHNERYYEAFRNNRPNNAYFMSFLRYYSATDSLESIWQNSYDSNLKKFVAGMKEYHK
ncbi:MAG: aminopeptidase [Ekhidna sp.]|nr:aminopeptidase [Ekhidna sp.]